MFSSNSAASKKPLSSPSASEISAYTKSIRPIASTRIIDGRKRTLTLGLVAMTCATTAPIWLFISVTPHWLEAVLSDLYGDSAVLNLGVVTGSAPSGLRGGGRRECRRTGS